MKKIFNIFAILLLVVIITGCGNSSNTESTSNSSSKKQISIDEILKDKNNYYITFNGTKLKVGDKISDILKTGYTIKDKDLEETVPSNRYLLGKSVIGKDNKTLFKVTPLNISSSTVSVKDAVVGRIEVGTYDYNLLPEELLNMNIEVYGGIKLGSTYDDMVRVFGTDYFEYNSNPDGLADKITYKSYKYSRGYKGFEFKIDKNGKISEIDWNNYDYNE